MPLGIESIHALLLFFMGASIGSFVNVVILRSIRGTSLAGRSHCQGCRKALTWWELVPVVSFTFLRGRCRSCAQQLSVQYPIVEALTGLVFLALLLPLPLTLSVFIGQLAAFAAFCLLLVLFVIDLRTFILPDAFVVMLGAAAVLRHAAVGISATSRLDWAVVAGAGFLFALWLVTKGKGIGFGDVKLMIASALLLGLPGTVTMLFFAFLIGGLYGSVLLLLRLAGPKTPLPLGPFLTGAAMVLLVWPGLAGVLWYIFLPGIL